MKKLTDNEQAILLFDSGSNSIIVVWKCPTTTDSFKLIHAMVLDKITQNQADGLIIDIFLQGLVTTENRRWLQNEILPRACKSGLRKLAVVAPGDLFSKYYIENILNGIEQQHLDIDLATFNDLIHAQAWLMEKEVMA